MRGISAALGRLGAAAMRGVPVLLRNAVGLASVGLIGYGSWLIYEPAGFIVGGLMLLTGVLLLSWKTT
jgi:hypothetical protein